MNPTQSTKFDALLASPAFRAAAAAAEAERVQTHQRAVDTLLEHEADSTAIQAAQKALEVAHRELGPIELAFIEARRNRASAEAELRRITWQREREAERLHAEINRHLPALLVETAAALALVEADIRSEFTARDTLATEWRASQTITNAGAVDAALRQAMVMRELIGRLAMDPQLESQIIAKLVPDALKLIDLAKACGAIVAHRLPEALRPGVLPEMPERVGPVRYAAQGCQPRR